MLTHAFTTAIGAAGILKAGCGLAGADAAADLAVLNATAMGFTLGALTLEQTKHLQARDAGPLTGLSQLPGLRAWRQRLGAIGNQVDPLALQRRMTAALLAHLPPAHQVFLADDHIAEYTGSKPVGWGRNPRRGKATKAHDDTYVCDLSGRALVVASGEPSGLSLTLPPVLAQLTEARTAATAAGSSNPAGRWWCSTGAAPTPRRSRPCTPPDMTGSAGGAPRSPRPAGCPSWPRSASTAPTG